MQIQRRLIAVLALSLLPGCRPAPEPPPAPAADAPPPQPEWELVWADEFDGDQLDLTSWTAEVMPDPHNEELQYYTDRVDDDEGANIRLADGMFVIEVRAEDYEHRHYTSGRLISHKKREFLYGRFEARLLNLAVGDWFDKDHPPPTDMAPQRLFVDYVRVYQRLKAIGPA